MDLTELYKLHEQGELDGGDARWNDVIKHLHKLTVDQVRKTARRLYGEPLEAAIVDVEGTLLGKFVSKRFSPLRKDTIEPVLRVAIRNDLLSLFRRTKSLTTVRFDGNVEETWECVPQREIETDMFAAIRGQLTSFRFPEHNHIREAILAYFLTREKYPGPGFLSCLGVGMASRQPVYNAAVVDLNCAMMGICDADAD